MDLNIKSFFCFLITILISGCKENPDTSLLIGDWVGEEYLSFTYSTFLNNYSSGRYIIDKDTIICINENAAFDDKIRIKYRINLLTSDSLELEAIAPSEKNILVLGKHADDTLNSPNRLYRFRRVTPKNEIVPLKIYYFSSICFGNCPSMEVLVDSSRNFYFWGKGFTKQEGFYSGIIDNDAYGLITERIRNLKMEAIRPYYSRTITDSQTSCISIFTKDDTIQTCSYAGTWPDELKILQHYLSNAYERCTLKADSTLNEKAFEQYYWNARINLN